jgi:hypothetical protein
LCAASPDSTSSGKEKGARTEYSFNFPGPQGRTR